MPAYAPTPAEMQLAAEMIDAERLDADTDRQNTVTMFEVLAKAIGAVNRNLVAIGNRR